jgi:hypothetical protein
MPSGLNTGNTTKQYTYYGLRDDQVATFRRAFIKQGNQSAPVFLTLSFQVLLCGSQWPTLNSGMFISIQFDSQVFGKSRGIMWGERVRCDLPKAKLRVSTYF